jgi:hypothetical protein
LIDDAGREQFGLQAQRVEGDAERVQPQLAPRLSGDDVRIGWIGFEVDAAAAPAMGRFIPQEFLREFSGYIPEKVEIVLKGFD